MTRVFLLFLLLFCFASGGPLSMGADQTERAGYDSGLVLAAETGQDNNKPDMQWFKKTMNIDPKYQEETTGILGMSVAHFILMVFLLLFFAATLINYYTRSRRTKKILLNILQEEKSEQS